MPNPWYHLKLRQLVVGEVEKESHQEEHDQKDKRQLGRDDIPAPSPPSPSSLQPLAGREVGTEAATDPPSAGGCTSPPDHRTGQPLR